MKWIIGTMVMLFAVSMVAQQNESGSASMPAAMSYMTTVPSSTVRHDIQATLDTSAEFGGSSISTTVDRNSVILEGSALSFGVKSDALQLASQYAGNRQVVDQIWVGGMERQD